MALAIDSSTPPLVASGTGSTLSLTTASFTPPVGALLAVMFFNGNNDTRTIIQPTNSAGTVSWDAAAAVSLATQGAVAEVWLGKVTASAAMTVTAQESSSGGAFWGFGVAVITGQAASPAGASGTASSAGAAPSVTVASLQSANSLVLGCVGDNSNSSTAPTFGSNQSGTFNGRSFVGPTPFGGWCQYDTRMSLAAGSSDTLNVTSPTIQFAMVALEILPTSTPAAGAVFPVFLPRNTLGRGVRNQGQMALYVARAPKPAISVAGGGAFTASDTSLSTDTAARVLALPRSASETSLTSDSAAQTVALPRTGSDTSLTSDTVSRLLALARSASDTSPSSDSATRTLSLPRTAADTSLTSDSPTRVMVLPRSASDTSTTSDSAARQLALPRATSDTSLSSDATTRAAIHYARSASDTSLTTDTASSAGQSLASPTIGYPTSALVTRLTADSGASVTRSDGQTSATVTRTLTSASVSRTLTSATVSRSDAATSASVTRSSADSGASVTRTDGATSATSVRSSTGASSGPAFP